MANILVIDDDLATLEQLNRMLKKWGHRVKMMLEQESLFVRLEEESFDLLLMDIHMPGISGVELLQQIKIDPKFHEIPVIMLTVDPDVNAG